MPVIPRDERYKLDARCDLLVSDALAALDAFNGTASPTLWLPLAQREHLTYYRGVAPVVTSPPHDPDGREQSLRFLVTGYLPGSLAQVTNGLYCDTTRALTLQQCVLLAGNSSVASDSSSNNRRGSTSAPLSNNSSGRRRTSSSDRRSSISSDNNAALSTVALGSHSALIDASVLYVSEQEHRRAPFRFAGTKWFAWRSHTGVGSSSPTNSVERDLLAYERSGAVHLDSDDSGSYNSSGSDANGDVMYHVVQSVERPPQGVDVAHFPPGLRHMKLSVCYLYRQVCDDLVECFAIGEYPALRRGVATAQQRVEDAAVADRVLIAAHALDAYSAKRLSRLIEKNSKLPLIMSKSCLRCSVRRTVFDPLRTCAICKKSVCKSCREERTIFQLNVDTNRPETETFCRKCIARSSLPVTVPTTIEKIQRQLKLRRSSPERSQSSSQPRSSSSWHRSSESHEHEHEQPHRPRRSSGASRCSSGSRDSIGSASGRASVATPASSGRVSAVAPGFNYDALFRHYAVEKPVVTRVRASTLPESVTSSSSSTSSTAAAATTNVRAQSVSAHSVDQPVAALDDATSATTTNNDVPVVAEEVDVAAAENLRATQLGLPVILVDVKSLRDTQLGVPVAIETGRVSEPSLHTTSHATLFAGAPIASNNNCDDNNCDDNNDNNDNQQQRHSMRASRVSRNSNSTCPPSSPSRRSDLYLAPRNDGNDGDSDNANRTSIGAGSGVERLYQTYLERREKLETAAADAQQLRHTRLQVARQYHNEQSRRSPASSHSSGSSSSPVSATSSSVASAASSSDDVSATNAPRRSDFAVARQLPPSSRSRRSEALPTKQHFHMDLYAQL